MNVNRGVSASQQGHLDCLCGIYSLINSLSYLYDGRIKRKSLINTLLKVYKYNYDIFDLLTVGLDYYEMDYLIELVIERGYYQKHYPVLITKPYSKQTSLRTQNIIKAIHAFIHDENKCHQRVVLIGTQFHWSVIVNTDSQYFYFFDSTSQIKAKHHLFSLVPHRKRYTLFPDAIYFIERSL